EELGWDRHSQTLEFPLDGQTYILAAVAEKRGFVAFLCSPSSDGRVPEYTFRRKIERLVSKTVLEHLIIHTDKERTTQVWQWVKRELGKPAQCREHSYHRNQPGDALIQKLQALLFTFEEEEQLSLVE